MSGSHSPMDTRSLPNHCTPVSQYLVSLSSAFNVCVPTNLALLSSALGIFSIISWLFAQIPQIYKNYQLQSAAGLSIYFLCEWFIGDLTNFIGALLTNQAVWQVVLALYYVSVDICLVFQYFWYSHVRSWRNAQVVECYPTEERPFEGSEGVIDGISPTSNGSSSEESDGKQSTDFSKQGKSRPVDSEAPKDIQSMAAWTLTEKEILPHASKLVGNLGVDNARQWHGTPAIRMPIILTALASVSVVSALPTSLSPMIQPMHVHSTAGESASETAGRILSWISTLSYLLSRFPQIIKNARRRSTSGLSASLFAAAFFGNLFYSTSILANPLAWASYPPHGLHGWVGPDGSDQWTWVKLALPFWLGAAGVLFMDGVIGVQFLLYGDGDKVVITIEDVDDPHRIPISHDEDGRLVERGRTRWRKVSGWMRGWIPSPSPSLVAGERRPLIAPRRSTDDRDERSSQQYHAT